LTEIVADEIGMLEDVDFDGTADGLTTCIRTVEGEIVVQLVHLVRASLANRTTVQSSGSAASREAAQNDELRQALKDMRLI
jgi:hypothetical protein